MPQGLQADRNAWLPVVCIVHSNSNSLGEGSRSLEDLPDRRKQSCDSLRPLCLLPSSTLHALSS